MKLQISIILKLIVMPSLRENAYLDPGSGSFIFQVLIATILSALFLVKTYWYKIRTFFRKQVSRLEENDGSRNTPH